MKPEPAVRRMLLSTTAACVMFAAGFAGGTAHALSWHTAGPPGAPAITALAVARPGYSIVFRPTHSILFAGTSSGEVFRSPDGGATWASTGPGLGEAPRALAIRQVFDLGVDTGRYDTTVFAATGNGVLRQTPNAAGWTPSNAGLTSLDVRALAVAGDGVVSETSAVSVFAGTAAGLFASSDGGDTWSRKTTGLPSGEDGAINALASDPTAPATLYAGTDAGMFRSSDGGESWAPLDALRPSRFSAAVIAVDPLVPTRIFASGVSSPSCFPACLGPSFFAAARSADGGRTWSRITGLDGRMVRSFAATPNLPAAVFAATEGGGVFRSADGGTEWEAVNDGLGDLSVSTLAVDPIDLSSLFAAGAHGAFSAALAQTPPSCLPGSGTACLGSRRFAVSVSWRDPGGRTGGGRTLPITDSAAAFWFFSPGNVELAVKVVEGPAGSGTWWVFYGSLTDVEFTLTVTDTATGRAKTYFNPPGRLASVADTTGF